MIAGYKRLDSGLCLQEQEISNAREMDNRQTGKDIYERTTIRKYTTTQ